MGWDCPVPRGALVLPNKSSELLRVFIESLFITHADCKLNQIGDLVYEKTDPNVNIPNTWYKNVYYRR
ncbi:unnamed protein product [Adineta ricciae]|uniref:Uncharacterized protein n=1 Tax=Adineta ricciae TaxID=249248 RepID=A0A816G439_ADIRI|nr:unnamed protein product [Adineta ricciae]